RLAFVREGFSWVALLVPLVWLLYHRMWIEFVVLLLVYVGLQLALGGDAQGQALTAWAVLAISVLFAFEANDLRTASLERRGYRLAGVASGRDRVDAERAFFTKWLPEQERTQPVTQPPPRRDTGARTPRPRGEGEEVIGLFPQP
ncbi:MAG: DUF2628 domain-containing protein, partial [Methyloceanibacter sp.]